MKPGRELDALVAEKVMGHKIFYEHGQVFVASNQKAFDRMLDEGTLFWDGTKDESEYCWQLPLYSTNIAVAWAVIIKMRKLGFGFTISDNANRHAGHIDCRFWHLDDDMRRGIAIKNEAPFAICLAALETMGIRDETR